MAGSIQSQLWEVALDQNGFVTSRDARALGINVVELGKLAHRHQLQRVGYGIYRFARLPVTEFDAYRLATLWADGRGALSHETALELYQLSDVNPRHIHVTVPIGYRPRRQTDQTYVVHHQDLAPSDTRTFEGTPIVTVAVAIDQVLRDGLQGHLVRQAMGQALAEGQIRPAQFDEFADRLEHRS